MKRPTRKEKVTSKIAKANSKPLPAPPAPRKEDDEAGETTAGPKKRKMMRAKAEKKFGKA